MDPDSFFDIVVPLLGMHESTLLCISTKGDDGPRNHYDTLMASGEIRPYEVQMICESCLAAGEEKECRHRRDRIPTWQTKELRDKIERIYGQAHHEKYLREVVGIVKKSGQCFPTNKVNDLFTRPPIPIEKEAVDHIFVGIDPAGGCNNPGSHGSAYSVVSIIQQGCLIAGIEAIDVSGMGMEYQDQIVDHFRRLLTIPKCESAKFVVAIENNWGLEAVTLGSRLQAEFRNRIIIMDSADVKRGTWTTDRVKENSMKLLQELFLRDEVHFAQGWITTHDKPGVLLEEFQGQTLRFEAVTDVPKTPFAKVRRKLSGKQGGYRDDMIVVLMLILWWREVFWNDKAKYGKWQE